MSAAEIFASVLAGLMLYGIVKLWRVARKGGDHDDF